jgi:hypothetical protein
MSSEEMEGTSPQWGSPPQLRKGTLGLWRTHRQHGGRAQNRPLAVCQEVGRGCGQTRRQRGVCAPALKPLPVWEGPRKKGQGFKPDHGKSGRPEL